MVDQDFEITIRVSQHLEGYTDQHLAALWHVSQANPAEYGDSDAGRATEYVGREIIRRFLKSTPPALWNHQGRDELRLQVRELSAELQELRTAKGQEVRHD